MSDETIHVEVVGDEQLEAMIARLEAMRGHVDELKTMTVETGQMASKLNDVELLSDVEKLPVVNREVRMLLSRVPGISDALSQYSRLNMIAGGVPSVGLLLMILNVYSLTMRLQEQFQQQAKEMEKAIREFQHLKTRGDYEQYLEEQKAKATAFMSQPL